MRSQGSLVNGARQAVELKHAVLQHWHGVKHEIALG